MQSQGSRCTSPAARPSPRNSRVLCFIRYSGATWGVHGGGCAATTMCAVADPPCAYGRDKCAARHSRDILCSFLTHLHSTSQALRKSLLDVKRQEVPVPEAPTFYPTIEELRDPMAYINRIAEDGKAAGIVRIVTPPGTEAGWCVMVHCMCGGVYSCPGLPHHHRCCAYYNRMATQIQPRM